MFRLLRKIISGVIAIAVILVIVAVLANTVFRDTAFGRFVRGVGETTQTQAANAALDASGIKEQIDQDLRSRTTEIAQATGMRDTQISAIIDNLDIPSWSVTTLPDGLTETGSFDTTYQGVAATVHTYTDPGYVTLTVGDQEITFAVPESTQAYVGYLSWL